MKLVIPPALILVIAFLSAHTGAFAQSKNCKVIEDLTVETSWKSTGSDRWTLTLKFDDSKLNDYAVMITRQGEEPQVFKRKEKDFEGLKKGLYEVNIIDRKGCSKQLNINIK